ncbi:hypothetical protein [Aquimarina spongiae]|uniref:Uncharacterized protein n=1 Tax=Aquimarina spongiae TaxID=570521 RepID=A0A1M6JFR2_9FLAO|nr:hypothetical protein [Aquimarina spongiae]SHJ45531.1 hypothetical protein SAMN04488508_10944 [Aquimarina spongiae]
MQSDNNKSLRGSISSIIQVLIGAAIISTMGFQMNASKNIAVMQTEMSMINSSLKELKTSKKEYVVLMQQITRDQDKLKIEVSNIKEKIRVLELAN